MEQKYIQTAILRSIEATKGRADYKKNVAGKFVLVDGDKYALILRLTNMELKSIEQ